MSTEILTQLRDLASFLSEGVLSMSEAGEDPESIQAGVDAISVVMAAHGRINHDADRLKQAKVLIENYSVSDDSLEWDDRQSCRDWMRDYELG
jgi:hypothetical protein